jgi:hypothetical protein
LFIAEKNKQQRGVFQNEKFLATDMFASFNKKKELLLVPTPKMPKNCCGCCGCRGRQGKTGAQGPSGQAGLPGLPLVGSKATISFFNQDPPYDTGVLVSNVPFELQPATTLSAASSDFVMSANGRLQYVGTTSRRTTFAASLTFSAVDNFAYLFRIGVTGTPLTAFTAFVTAIDSTQSVNVAFTGTVLLAPNDYLSVFVIDQTGGGDIVIPSFQLTAW